MKKRMMKAGEALVGMNRSGNQLLYGLASCIVLLWYSISRAWTDLRRQNMVGGQ